MRRFAPASLAIVLLLGFGVSAGPPSRTFAQSGAEATVSALQTEVASLSTTIALQTEVAELEAQLTPVADPEHGGSEEVIFEADWSDGLNGWMGPLDWKVVGGVLVNDGSNSDRSYLLVLLPDGTNSNYAVEAEIQVARAMICDSGFGLVVRAQDDRGYRFGPSGIGQGCVPSLTLADVADARIESGFELRPDSEWHTYRVEVEGNQLRFLYDGRTLMESTDSTYLDGRYVGFVDFQTQLNIRSFKVVTL